MSTADDLLRKAYGALVMVQLTEFKSLPIIAEIRSYLDAPEMKDEPVAWVPEDELPERYPYNFMFQYSKVDIIRWFPVYGPPTKTAPMKPMTGDEVLHECFKNGCDNINVAQIFLDGVRFAERHHGIGGDE